MGTGLAVEERRGEAAEAEEGAGLVPGDVDAAEVGDLLGFVLREPGVPDDDRSGLAYVADVSQEGDSAAGVAGIQLGDDEIGKARSVHVVDSLEVRFPPDELV